MGRTGGSWETGYPTTGPCIVIWSGPRSPAAVANPARILLVQHPGSLGLFRMHTSLEDPSLVTCSLWMSPHPTGIGNVGQTRLG